MLSNNQFRRRMTAAGRYEMNRINSGGEISDKGGLTHGGAFHNLAALCVIDANLGALQQGFGQIDSNAEHIVRSYRIGGDGKFDGVLAGHDDASGAEADGVGLDPILL